jgi:hypothetical protein
MSTRSRGGLTISYLRVIPSFAPAGTNHIKVYGSRYYLIADLARPDTKVDFLNGPRSSPRMRSSMSIVLRRLPFLFVMFMSNCVFPVF